jgi:pimeloyl-ACP methyl ester carboxylesterase
MLPSSRIRVEIDGLSVAYHRAGNGPALVLLHGFTQDSRVWRSQLESLSTEFTVIAWDAPGAGESSDPPDSFRIGDWAESLAGILNHAGIQQAHMVGLSWGGLLAQEFYSRQSERVLSLVLADTYAGWKGSLPEPLPEERLSACLRDSSLLPAEFVSLYLPAMLSRSVSPEVRKELAGIMSDFHPAGFRLMATALAQADTRELLPQIHVPTLLIWGDRDERVPIAVADQFLNAVPGANFAVIRGAGHVSNMESPTEFNAHVREFCSGAKAH